MDIDTTPTASDTTASADSTRIIKHARPQISDESIQMPWVEKYRPSSLEELVAHEDIVSILTRLIDNDNLPHLLLYGPPGTGKVRVDIMEMACIVSITNEIYISLIEMTILSDCFAILLITSYETTVLT